MIKKFMEAAYAEAEKAVAEGNVPVGAVVVYNGRIIASAHNGILPTAHAEKEAIEKALVALSSKTLAGCDVYVTLEPCPMCAGAIMLSGADNVYFGAYDSKYGACQSADNMFARYKNIKSVRAYGGILEEKCKKLIQSYFKEKRNKYEDEKKETQG